MDHITVTSEILSKAIVVPIMCVFVTIWLWICYKWNVETLELRYKLQKEDQDHH